MIFVGAVLGFLSGMFGVGGSSIATPLLRMLGVPQMIALATPLPVTLPTAVVGGLTYWRRGLVDGRVVLLTGLGGAPAVVLGSYLTKWVPGRALMLAAGLFVLAISLQVLRQPVLQGAAGHSKARPALLVIVGAVVGLVSGLLANGGGFLLVPAYLLILKMDLKRAAATSLVAVALLAIPGTWVHWRLGHIDARLAAQLAIGVIPAAWLGPRAALHLNGRWSKLAFGLFLLCFGLVFVIHTIDRAILLGWWHG